MSEIYREKIDINKKSYKDISHYTSPLGLDGILKSKTIRFTEFSVLNDAFEGKMIYECLDYCLEEQKSNISVDLIKYLRQKGIETVHINVNLSLHIAYLNQAMLENIDSIKELIPTWIRWEYVKSIFLMPGCYAGARGSAIQNSNQSKKVISAINLVRKQLGMYSSFYPYGAYLNWSCDKIKPYYGNILFNDEKFLKILYASFDDTFHANEYVIDATQEDKDSIYDFIDESINIAILVDCENVDPYRFVSVFKNLEEKIYKR